MRSRRDRQTCRQSRRSKARGGRQRGQTNGHVEESRRERQADGRLWKGRKRSSESVLRLGDS